MNFSLLSSTTPFHEKGRWDQTSKQSLSTNQIDINSTTNKDNHPTQNIQKIHIE